MTTLRQELEDLPERAPHQVRLVLEHDRVWDQLLAQVDLVETWQTLSNVSSRREQHLRELAEGVRRVPSLVADWQGPARVAFESTVNTMARRIDVLADLGTDQRTLDTVAEAIRRETESVIRDLVTSTIHHATRTLTQAIQLVIVTSGESLRAWVVSALILARRTLRLVVSCVERAQQLRVRIGTLSAVLDEDTQRVQDSLDQITRRLT